MRILLVVILLYPLSVSAEFSKADMQRQIALTALWSADWLQARYVATHDEFYEKNKILGKYPTTGDVNRYFAAVIGMQWLVAYYLPPKPRKIFQFIWIISLHVF